MNSLRERGIAVVSALVLGVFALGSYALAHGPGERHEADRNSPSDLMMEQCTQMGLGPEGHTQIGRMIDQMHGEGAHHRMHQFMDQMMGGSALGPRMMGNGMMNPGTPRGGGMMRGMMFNASSH